jgi:predicted dithiol-disulfide oxidoreductase (DUF899 family)
VETTINTSYKTPIVTPSECGDRVYRTYFINGREHEPMGGTWSTLDIAAFGRQEDWEDSPEGYPQDPQYSWLNWHDGYGPGKLAGEQS